MLRILSLYILRELAEAFAVTLAALTFLLPLTQVVGYVRDGLPAYTVLILMTYAVPHMLQWTVPAALLMACVTAYGRLASDNEVLAMRASGIHPFRLIFPALALAAGAVVLGTYLNSNVVPNCRMARKRAKHEMAFGAIEDMSIPARGGGPDANTIQISDFRITYKELKDKMMYGVVVHSRDAKGLVNVIDAKWAVIQVDREAQIIEVQLHKGKVSLIDKKRTFNAAPMEFDEYALVIELGKFQTKVVRGPRDMATDELKSILRKGCSLYNPKKPMNENTRREIESVISRRRAMAWASLPFFLIGVPLVLITRRGKKLIAFVVSLGVILAFYPMLLLGEGLALKGYLSAWIALPACDVAIGSLGVVLMAKYVWRR